jgi:hypothetical protein
MCTRLLASVILLASGCDQLGNPPRRFRTPEVAAVVGPFTLSTRTETVPAARATELMRRIEGRPHHIDEGTSAYVTLVVVEIAPRGVALPSQISLATDFASADGQTMRRVWTAPGAARPFVAVFRSAAVPAAAQTTRGP